MALTKNSMIFFDKTYFLDWEKRNISFPAMTKKKVKKVNVNEHLSI